MKKLFLVAVLLASLGIFGLSFESSETHAQQLTNYQRNLLKGSFMRSCQNVKVNQHGIEAVCRRKNGSWKRAVFAYGPTCRDLANIDGNLKCLH